MNRLQTSWEIAKRSWAVLQSDKSLAWFPVFSLLGSLVVFGVFGGLVALAGHRQQRRERFAQADGLGVHRARATSALAFVQTYFLAALVAGADARLRGRHSSVSRARDRELAAAPTAAVGTRVGDGDDHPAGDRGTVRLRRRASSPGSSGWRGTSSRSSPCRSSCSRTSASAPRSSARRTCSRRRGARTSSARPASASSASSRRCPACRSSRSARARYRGPRRVRRDRRGVARRGRDRRRRAERHLPHRPVPLRIDRPGPGRVRGRRLPGCVRAAAHERWRTGGFGGGFGGFTDELNASGRTRAAPRRRTGRGRRRRTARAARG